ncbi:hypothetical protein [Paenibacillus sp. IHBB 10380]|uniref:hypothetical protein n=1 Tax=Paenibacillus sp. IHBB 10380 TaxID=1566358 RepID=UPI0005CFC0AD|nr:hypothetical protein [Paenibacillus sp. IHBB 10380]AJS57216.1 hypothetical protein UB51_00400 [Paenibacillus sp. IHBB 10380]
MSNVKLSWHYPLIASYPRHAYPLSIITGLPNSKPWIYTYYVPLVCKKNVENYTGIFLDFGSFNWLVEYNPWINSQNIKREILMKCHSDIIGFTKKCIDMNYYLFIHLDEFFIPNTEPFQKWKSPHAVMILGYNPLKRTFNISNFTKNRKYEQDEISFEHYVESFQKMETTEDYMENNYLLQINNNVSYNYDINIVMDIINDYISSKRTSYSYYRLSEAFSDDYVYGLDIYDYLKNISICYYLTWSKST